MDSISLEQIKELIKTMEEHSIHRFSFKTKSFELELGSDSSPTQQGHTLIERVPVSEVIAAAETSPPEPLGQIVTSPIVGTFYASVSPDKPPFVKIGSEVATGDTLFIIESMKLMNEVTSDYAGTVAEILVENGQGVEYGQPILRIQ